MNPAENTTVQKEGWIGPLLFMSPSITVAMEILVGMFLWPVQKVQCGTFDFTCGFGAALDDMTQILLHYPPLFYEIPLMVFFIFMFGAFLIGDH